MVKLGKRSESLYEELKAYIMLLPEGCTLPSINELKKKYSAGQSTLNKVLQILEKENLITVKPQKGIVVQAGVKDIDSKNAIPAEYRNSPYISARNSGDIFCACIGFDNTERWHRLFKAFVSSHPKSRVKLKCFMPKDFPFPDEAGREPSMYIFPTYPDLIIKENFSTYNFVNLSNIIGTLESKDFFDGFQERDENGRLWALAPQLGYYQIYHNRSISSADEYKHYGWDNLFQFANNFCSKNVYNKFRGFTSLGYIPFLFHNGAFDLNAKSGCLKPVKDNLEQAVEKIQNVIKEYKISPYWELMAIENFYKPFREGEILFSHGYSSSRAEVLKNLDFETAVYPYPLENANCFPLDREYISFNRRSLYFDECWEFARFIFSKNGQGILAESTTNFPALKGIRPKNMTENEYEQTKPCIENGKGYEHLVKDNRVFISIECEVNRFLKYGGTFSDLLKEVTSCIKMFCEK